MGLDGSKNSGEIDTNYVSGPFIFGCKKWPGPTHLCEIEYVGNMGHRYLGIISNQLLGIPTTYKRSAAYM